MRYLFSCGEKSKHGNYIIPKEKVNHWKRQMNIRYEDLTEKEKETDKWVARKVMKVLDNE